MDLYTNRYYQQDLQYVANLNLPWDKLRGKSIMISGATGMIGSFLIDVLITKNLPCKIYALSRCEDKIRKRFPGYVDNDNFTFIKHDVTEPLSFDDETAVDYVVHLASNTHPLQYSNDPIGTITANIIGVKNLLDFAVAHNTARFVFASSNEIYGENRGDVEFFSEDYCGYINSNTLRAGYPESKRCGEALCQAYKSQKALDVVIPRFTRTYGSTMLMSDTKAISQFIKKGIAGEDIVLKSEGKQYYSYQYVADSVSGLLTIMLKGQRGEAYNIADSISDIRLKDLAAMIAKQCGVNVVYELPDTIEARGYSTATKARLDGTKLKGIGWQAKFDIEEGIRRTLEILQS